MKNEIVTLNYGNVSVTEPFNEVIDMLRFPEQSNPNVNQNSEQILIRIFEYLRVDYDKQKIQMIKVARTYFNMDLGDAKNGLKQIVQTWSGSEQRPLRQNYVHETSISK